MNLLVLQNAICSGSYLLGLWSRTHLNSMLVPRPINIFCNERCSVLTFTLPKKILKSDNSNYLFSCEFELLSATAREALPHR